MLEFRVALLHCGLVDLVFKEISSHGIMDALGMLLFKNGWIEHVQIQNGDLFFPMQRSFTSNLSIMITIRLLSIYPCLTKHVGRKKYHEGLRKSGHIMKDVRWWSGLPGRPKGGLAAYV